MKYLIQILLVTFFSLNSFADCDDARRKCRNECASTLIVNGMSLDAVSTDFSSNCEDACKKGTNECEDTKGSMSDKCDEFKSKCKRTCPDSVFVYTNSKGIKTGYSFTSDANSICEDACSAGYRRCD